MVNAREILDFWFKQTPPELWFGSDPEFYALMGEKFEETWRHAREMAVSQGGSMEDSLARKPII